MNDYVIVFAHKGETAQLPLPPKYEPKKAAWLGILTYFVKIVVPVFY